ncbi:MAG: hypothetical protein A2784_00355 [Candidatus Chisholmbacteria bacterium RIFCSPHIGHO2_01_FULL_48_12]|uniref:Uncharacterized protein n=1 Tax=Candidatus Chisholmbacteria bacterium RIFCSPHIGHO2_01_FULL_48_12 TaxID=1797589 RepID=A0A1G1VUE0_9BACT|nr:MAG: hypothetical protein A2784_00355 [Candidatus Chisholmbacteria bacterium RIFCSPHIGHO2_01_FULL_48_12]
MGPGGERLRAGVEIGVMDKVKMYKEVITYGAAMAYGEQGRGIDWAQPPVLGGREEVYLRALKNLADKLGQGDLEMTRVRLETLAGLVCAPELSMVVGMVKVELGDLLVSDGWQRRDFRGITPIVASVKGIVVGYRSGEVDRTQLAESLFDLTAIVDQRVRGLSLTNLTESVKRLFKG